MKDWTESSESWNFALHHVCPSDHHRCLELGVSMTVLTLNFTVNAIIIDNKNVVNPPNEIHTLKGGRYAGSFAS